MGNDQIIYPSRIQTERIDSTFKQLVKQAESRNVSVQNLRTEQIQAPALVRRHKGLERTGARKIASNVTTLDPHIRNPLLSATNFYLPHDRLELNAWIRYFDRFHPLVGNAIDMHSTVPFSRFQLIGITDPYVQQFYDDMSDQMDLFMRIIEVSREWELMGEAFPFAYWDEEQNAFSDVIFINPDYVEVRGVKMAGSEGLRYELVISEELRQFIHSEDPLDWEIIQKLDPALISAAESGLNAPLDPFNLTHLARFANPYDTRGSTIILGCLKDLLYEEQLREAQYAITGGIIRPREVWKLGIRGEYMPTDADLEDLRSMLKEAEYDANFAIVSHHGLEVEMLGADRRILPIMPELQEIEKRILTRLYTSKAMTHGEGPTYSNASVAMTILDARYAAKRDMVIDWVTEAIFTPVALANEFYKPNKRELNGHYRVAGRRRELMIPKFKWLSLVNLVDKKQQIQYAMQLRQRNDIPMKQICDLLQLDYYEVIDFTKKEYGTILDPSFMKAREQALASKAMQSGGTVNPADAPKRGLVPANAVAEEGKGKEDDRIPTIQEMDEQVESETVQTAEEEKVPPQEKIEPKVFSSKKKGPRMLCGEEYLEKVSTRADKLLEGFSKVKGNGDGES